MTHQDIIDRAEALLFSQGAAYRAELARIQKERESIQELCGGLGHIFGKSKLFNLQINRACVFCGLEEVKAA